MVARKKIIIHAGFHRCASTATQDFLRRYRAEIEAGGTAVMLREDFEGWLSGRQLRLLYRHQAGSALSAIRLWLVKRMLRCVPARRILISEELLLGLMPGVRDVGFYPHFGNFLSAVKALGEAFDIELRFIVRRQDNFLESAYAFRVPRGMRKSFSDFTGMIGTENVSWRTLLRQVETAGLAPNSRFMVLESLKRNGAGQTVGRFLGIDDLLPAEVRFSRGNPRKTADELHQILGGDVNVAFTDEARSALLARHESDNKAFLGHPIVTSEGAWDA